MGISETSWRSAVIVRGAGTLAGSDGQGWPTEFTWPREHPVEDGQEQPRAELWKWTRLSPDTLLIDNSAEVARTGIRDDARVLSRQAASSHTAQPAAESNGFLLKGSLPIPPMPRVSLPAEDSPGVAAARGLVVGWLPESRRVVAELHSEQASPDDEPNAMRKLDKLTTRVCRGRRPA